MSIKLKDSVRLRDALHNLSAGSGSSFDYDQGIMVGAMSALMASTGKDYEEVAACLRECMPTQFNIESIPEAWRSEFK